MSTMARRSGGHERHNPMTIELLGAMRKLSIDPLIQKNILSLVEIRDTAIHYFHNRSLKYVIYTLGVAALRNYQRLVKDWFSASGIQLLHHAPRLRSRLCDAPDARPGRSPAGCSQHRS